MAGGEVYGAGVATAMWKRESAETAMRNDGVRQGRGEIAVRRRGLR